MLSRQRRAGTSSTCMNGDFIDTCIQILGCSSIPFIIPSFNVWLIAGCLKSERFFRGTVASLTGWCWPRLRLFLGWWSSSGRDNSAFWCFLAYSSKWPCGGWSRQWATRRQRWPPYSGTLEGHTCSHSILTLALFPLDPVLESSALRGEVGYLFQLASSPFFSAQEEWINESNKHLWAIRGPWKGRRRH